MQIALFLQIKICVRNSVYVGLWRYVKILSLLALWGLFQIVVYYLQAFYIGLAFGP